MPSQQDQWDGWFPAGDVGHLIEVGPRSQQQSRASRIPAGPAWKGNLSNRLAGLPGLGAKQHRPGAMVYPRPWHHWLTSRRRSLGMNPSPPTWNS